MSLRRGDMIGSYRILQDFAGGANCNWSFAERGGAEFFVKEFHRPKYPPDVITGTLRAQKLARCGIFETRHKRLVDAMNKVCAPGGNIVMPANFVRFGLVYYHIAPRIDTASLNPREISALPPEERLILLRLLSRSLLTLHSQQIVHGDLKPSNILIHRSGGGLLAPKLIDFDGSFFHGEPPDQEDMAFDQNYMSPEVLAYNKVEGAAVAPKLLGTGADIFSFSVLLHEYWTGGRPALPDGHLYISEAIRAGGDVKLHLPGMEPVLQEAVRQGLSAEPGRRPSIERLDQLIGDALKRHRSGAAESPAAKRSGHTPISIRTTPRPDVPIPATGLRGFAAPDPELPTAPGGPTGITIRKSRNLSGDER